MTTCLGGILANRVRNSQRNSAAGRKHIAGRTVVVIEDIIDTGLTMKYLLEDLQTRNPKEIKICTLLLKPEKLEVDLNISYVAMRILNDFIIGYGLDYEELGRNCRDIYAVVNER